MVSSATSVPVRGSVRMTSPSGHARVVRRERATGQQTRVDQVGEWRSPRSRHGRRASRWCSPPGPPRRAIVSPGRTRSPMHRVLVDDGARRRLVRLAVLLRRGSRPIRSAMRPGGRHGQAHEAGRRERRRPGRRRRPSEAVGVSSGCAVGTLPPALETMTRNSSTPATTSTNRPMSAAIQPSRPTVDSSGPAAAARIHARRVGGGVSVGA